MKPFPSTKTFYRTKIPQDETPYPAFAVVSDRRNGTSRPGGAFPVPKNRIHRQRRLADGFRQPRSGPSGVSRRQHRGSRRRGALRRGAARTAAHDAQHRDRQGHHLPAAEQVVLDDAALPHAEHGGALVRPRLLAHADRGARQAAAPALRRLHLLAQAGLLHPARIHSLRHQGAAQRQHEHRPRRNRLLRTQRTLEHRLRTDENQGQPRPRQLVECPAVRRPQHRQQRIQPRPRLRILR